MNCVEMEQEEEEEEEVSGGNEGGNEEAKKSVNVSETLLTRLSLSPIWYSFLSFPI